MLRNVTGNNIGLRAGEIVTARELLAALIVGGSARRSLCARY